MFDSFDDLIGTLEDYLERSDLASRMPTFVRLAETRLDRRLNLAENETSVLLFVEEGGATPLPDDYRAWRALNDASGRSYEYASPHAFASERDGLRRAGCGAGSFTIVGAVTSDTLGEGSGDWTFGIGNPFLRVSPPPAGSLTLVYRQGIPPLGTDRPSNWLLARNPDLYLYAALVEAEPFLRNDARIMTWKRMLDEALSDLASLDRDARWGRSRMRLSEPTP